MAKSTTKKTERLVKVQLGAAVSATIDGYKFINGQGVVPEKVAKAKKWKIIEDDPFASEEPKEEPKTKELNQIKPSKKGLVFEPAAEGKKEEL